MNTDLLKTELRAWLELADRLEVIRFQSGKGDASELNAIVNELFDRHVSTLNIVRKVLNSPQIPHLAKRQYSGLDNHLVDDVLASPDRGLPSDQVIVEAFRTSFANTWFVPYWKHLRLGGYLDGGGDVLPGTDLHPKIYTFISRDLTNLGSRLLPTTGKKFQNVLALFGEDRILSHPWDLLDETQDTDGLKDYLIGHRHYRQQVNYPTQYAKLALALDWLLYDPPHKDSE